MLTAVRQSIRRLWRRPVLGVTCVLCLAIGIGVNATMLETLDRLLLRPPDHVVDAASVHLLQFEQRSGAVTTAASYPTFEDLRGHVPALSEIAAYTKLEASLGRGREARHIRVGIATPSFFRLLGVRPESGRFFADGESDPNLSSPDAVVSWEFWRSHLGGARSVLGQDLPIGARHYSVVGITPPGFRGVQGAGVDVWLPIGALGGLEFTADPEWSSRRSRRFLSVIGRLRSGSPPSLAAAQATQILAASFIGGGSTLAPRVVLTPIQEGRLPRNAQRVNLALWLSAASAAVLLIACLNVASLLAVRAWDRRSEFAVRVALGSSTAGVARLLLVEVALVLSLGALAGCGVFAVGRRMLGDLIVSVSDVPAAGLDLRNLALIASLSLIAGALCCVAVLARERSLGSSLRAVDDFAWRSSPRALVVALQFAATFSLLTLTVLLVRSFDRVRHVDLGMDTDHVAVVTVDLAAEGYSASRIDRFYADALARVRTIPQVDRATVAAAIPFQTVLGTAIAVPGRGDVAAFAPGAAEEVNAVADDYFATFGTAIVRGRPLLASDNSSAAAPVVVVNEAAARRFWGSEPPLGRCIQVGDGARPCATVVGVSEDAKSFGLRSAPGTLQVFVPLAQAPASMTGRALFVRSTQATVSALATSLRNELSSVDSALPFVDVKALAVLLDPQLRPWEMGAELFALFGVVALLLATVAAFGAVAATVASRSRELGIRMALGATPRALVRMTVLGGLRPVIVGLAVGVLVSAVAARFVGSLLFETPAYDPAAWLAPAGILLTSALAACLVAARRARTCDPAALQSDLE